MLQSNYKEMVIQINHHLNSESLLFVIVKRMDHVFTIFMFLFYTYARWKGTGKPCPNFL